MGNGAALSVSGLVPISPKRHERTCRTILVEKTDRLYRNIKDDSIVEDLALTSHFAKKNVIIGPRNCRRSRQRWTILRLTSNACHAFRVQTEPEQRKLLTMMVQEAQWKDGRLQLLEPFELLRRSNRANTKGINGNGGPEKAFEIWLPRKRGFQRPLRAPVCT